MLSVIFKKKISIFEGWISTLKNTASRKRTVFTLRNFLWSPTSNLRFNRTDWIFNWMRNFWTPEGGIRGLNKQHPSRREGALPKKLRTDETHSVSSVGCFSCAPEGGTQKIAWLKNGTFSRCGVYWTGHLPSGGGHAQKIEIFMKSPTQNI